MRILTIDNIHQRLIELEKTIKTVLTNDAVKLFTDSMMAAKYGIRYNVDIIIEERKIIHTQGFGIVSVIYMFI